MIDGTKIKNLIYYRPKVSVPIWCKEYTTFEDIFYRPNKEPSSVFALYRDENQVLQKDEILYRNNLNYKMHPIDFKNNEVHIVITELDKLPTGEYNKKYAQKVFNETKKSKYVLFSYVTGSGMGVRVAYYSKYSFKQKEYHSMCKCLSQRNLKWDDEKQMTVDPNVYSGDVVWFCPLYKDYIWINTKCQPIDMVKFI